MQALGKTLIVAGLLIAALGVIITFTNGTIPLGSLPGDISIKREHFSLYFPITTCILISIVISLVIWLVARFLK